MKYIEISYPVLFLLLIFLLSCTNAKGEIFGEKSDQDREQKKEKIKNKAKEIISNDGAVMDLVSAGKFTMGYAQGDGDEKPEHTVYLDAYYIDRYEVTLAQYLKCVKAKHCKEEDFWGIKDFEKCNYDQEGRENYPMNCVNWYGMRDYCEWAGKRLPTEAEWEKAARGPDKRSYPWGNKPKPGCDYVVMVDGDDGNGCGKDRTFEVGSKPKGAGPYGTQDFLGNVYEWCSDWHCDDYYSKSPEKNPKGCKEEGHKILRGGSWSWGVVRSSFRSTGAPNGRNNNIGGRCVRN